MPRRDRSPSHRYTQSPYARRLRVETLEDRRLLAVLTVQNNLDDTLANLAGDGELSLREAIEIANNPGLVIDGFSSGDVADEIVFGSPAFDVPQTITLEDGELEISETLTISADFSQKLTIDALEASRIVYFSASTGDLILQGMTLENGRNSHLDNDHGGAIRFNSTGHLTVSRSVIRNSTTGENGGAIYSNGSVTVANSSLYRNRADRTGGGVHAIGDITILDSVVSHNTLERGAYSSQLGAGVGVSGLSDIVITRSLISDNRGGRAGDSAAGGVYAQGTLTVEHSSIVSNESQSVPSDPTAGGILVRGDLFLRNSTVSGNRSSHKGGGVTAYGNITLDNATITRNRVSNSFYGGAIFVPNPDTSMVTMRNSIVADNLTFDFNVPFGDPSTPVKIQSDFSLIGSSNHTDLTPSQVPDENGNLIGERFSQWINPLLGPLATNGGITKSHALLPGSPAIDAGDPAITSAPTHDQRGAPFTRIANGGVNGTRIDIGAYELQSLPNLNLVVDTNSDEVDGNLTAGNLSLREAIGLANGNPGHDTITFDASLEGETIVLGGRELDLGESATIDASGFDLNMVIDADEYSRIFHILSPTGDYYLSGLTLSGGRTFSNNVSTGTLETSDHSGGAIRTITAGTVTLSDSVFYGNRTLNHDANGGAVFASAGELILQRVEIYDNFSERGSGGGVYTGITEKRFPTDVALPAELLVVDSTISGNGANLGGGGLFTRGFMEVRGSTISENRSYGTLGGGGLFAAAEANLVQATLISNTSLRALSTAGAGGLAAQGTLNVSGSIIAGNTSFASENDIQGNPAGISYSIIGDTTGTTIDENTGVGNLLNVDPLLGPLADNGGPTRTHALLPGSPAIDAGDPAILFDMNEFDQRGAPFLRVADGNLPNDIAIDIGAYEAQSVASADFDSDGDVDGRDFLTWQRGFGLANALRVDGNSDDDTDVDASDLAAWIVSYGGAAPVASGQTLGASRLGDNDDLAAVAGVCELLDEGEVGAGEEGNRQEPVVEVGDAHIVKSSRALYSSERRRDYREVSDLEREAGTFAPWLSDELLERVFG